MPAITTTPLIDQAVAEAKNLPQLIATLQTIDPNLAASLETKPLLASKTPWGTLLATIIAWASTHYALGWNDSTCAIVAGAALVLMSYAMRALSPATIRGFFKSPPAADVAPATVSVVSRTTASAIAALGVIFALQLAACSTSQTANVTGTVTTTLTAAQADLQKATTFYGIAKGIALAAELADPSVAPTITTAIAVLDPLAATAQQLLTSATTDAPQLEALAQQIQTQATTLTVTAAPAVKVVGGL